tara:strand:- start:4239 stop:7295 length:3057 start_codon:yes stop_codon:yes gene_type:complete
MKDSIGVFDDEVYRERLAEIFTICGIPVQGFTSLMPNDAEYDENNDPSLINPLTAVSFMDSISEMISPFELLSLFRGNAAYSLLKEIHEMSESDEQYQTITYTLDTTSKIESFFVCLGENLSEDVIEQVRSDIIETYENPEMCIDVVQELKSQMEEKCPGPKTIARSVYKEVYDSAIKYKRIVNLLRESKGEDDKHVPSLFNDGPVKGILSSEDVKPKSQDFVISKVSQTIMMPALISARMDMAEYFTEKYGTKGVELMMGIKESPETATNSAPNYFSSHQFDDAAALSFSTNLYANQYLFANSPELYLFTDGRMQIINTFVNDKYVPSLKVSNTAIPIGNTIQNAIDSSQKLNDIIAESEFSFSKQQSVFYELIRKYYTDKYPSSSGNLDGTALAYFLHRNSYANFENSTSYENLYHNMFSEMLESIMNLVATRWTGTDGTKSLKEYSKAISNNMTINKILQYDQAKQMIMDQYDLADYDNPNDTAIGKKQYALLAGVFHIYHRAYIMEYLARAMPFYEVFGFSSLESGGNFKLAAKYIKELIKVDLGTAEDSSYIQSLDFLTDSLGLEPTTAYILSQETLRYERFAQLCKEVVEFLREKGEITQSEYASIDKSNTDWSVEYYIDKNFMSVYEVFASDVFGEDQSAAFAANLDALFGSFDYSRPVHDIAGVSWSAVEGGLEYTQYTGKSYVTNGDTITGALYNQSTNSGNPLDDESFSLLANSSMFTRGKFFIQNYFYLEEGGTNSNSNFKNRSPHEKRVVSEKTFHKLIASLIYGQDQNQAYGDIPDIGNDFSISSVFSSVKVGSRLCYGVAVDYKGSENSPGFSATNRVGKCAQKIFDAYTSTTSNLTSTEMSSGKTIAKYDNSLICPDGASPIYDATNGALNLRLTDQAPDVEDPFSYSIVIPFCSVETEMPPSTLMSYLLTEEGQTLYEDGFDYKSEWNKLNSDIFKTEEYKALREFCFPVEDMLMYASIFGVQVVSYNNPTLQSALASTKINLISSIKSIENAKKWDYLKDK